MMRKILPSQVLVFVLLFFIIIILSVGTVVIFLARVALGDFRGVVLTIAWVVSLYLYAFLIYRLFLWVIPLREGENITEGSRDELAAHVNILFYLILFNSLIRTHFLPVPLIRVIYLMLGARLGKNTYSAGTILDPPLTRIGENCIIGHDAVLFSHTIEGKHFSLEAIRIGNNVTVGAKAIIMAGVTILDNAIVSAGAVVTKGTNIGVGEIWGGIPAKRLRQKAVGVEEIGIHSEHS